MNPSLSVAAASALLVALWLLGRPRPRLSSRQDTAAIAALNREQIVRVIQPPEPAPATAGPPSSLPAIPTSAAERLRFLAQLERWSRASTGDRLRAMQVCAQWGHRSVLPLLRRGRHDPDPGVALAAARGLERFRGRSAAPLHAAQPLPAPRRVSRTR